MPVLTKINTNVIADDAVTAAKIPADALGATDIAANAIGTSEIATGGVLPANIAYLGDGSGNLSGTITNQQLHFGTAFTLTDDLTVNGDVTLGKVRDDGTGQSITGDGKTLTGTGTLTMGSSVEGEPKTGRSFLGGSPSGAASSATFLRGDNAWAVAGSTSASDLDSGTLTAERMLSGSVVKQSFIGNTNIATEIATTSTSFADSGLECAHTTRLSSSDSYLIFDFQSSMDFQATAQAEADCLVRTSSSSTYDSDESIAPSNNGHGMWMQNYGDTDIYKPISTRLFMGLVSGMGMPDSISTWDADDTLYFRIFIESTSGPSQYVLVHVRASWSISITEVKR